MLTLGLRGRGLLAPQAAPPGADKLIAFGRPTDPVSSALPRPGFGFAQRGFENVVCYRSGGQVCFARFGARWRKSSSTYQNRPRSRPTRCTCYCSGVSSTRISLRVHAPRASVYRALLDARAVATWMVPTGMTSHVHAFDPREGGSFRISLTYDAPTGTGKTTAHTDTYHGRFVKLVPNEQVVEVVEFETADPALRGEMTIAITLAEADGATDVLAVHDGLPPGLSPADNEAGWRSSLAKLAALVEAG